MIYLCEYDGFLDSQTLQDLAHLLPISLPDGWESGLKWEKARQRILAWILLAYGLEWYQAIQNNFMGELFRQLAIRRDEHGKPYSSRFPKLHLNISHSENACACIIDEAPVGIDVEKKFPYKENLARKACHPQEKEILDGMEREEREHQLQLLWSMKESFVKRDGRGLAYGLERINLSKILPVKEKGAAPVFLSLEYDPDITFQLYNKEEFTLAACSGREQKITIIRERDLFSWINAEKI